MHHFIPNLIFLLVIQAFLANCCLEHERDALLEFKAGVGDMSKRLASWRGNECCDWAWIRCSNQTGHVVKLNLRNTKFEFVDGSYEDSLSYWNYHSLTGKISPSLASLSDLKYLDLGYNNFGGNKFPKFISSLKNLKYLNLSNTGLSGMIPPQLGNLSRLFYLDLSCEYSGYILYTDTWWWFSNLRSLRYMEMSGVDFKDTNDWVESLNKLPSLEVLVLSNNGLTQISNSLTFVNFTSLRVLHLFGQNFNSTIPNWLGSLKSLTDLLLESCNLVSPYPATLGNLSSLSKLTLDSNSLDGMIPPMRNLTRLNYLSISRNNIEGDIGELLEKFTLGKLQYLDISFTNLSGILSEAQLSSLLRLKTLELSGNNISVFVESNWTPTIQLNHIGMFSCNLGPKFPSWLERQIEIQYLNLDDTGIDDNIPSWFWKLSSLQAILLYNNRLRGNLPASLVHMTKLFVIDLSNNRLEGEIPFLPISLTELILSNNSFSGKLRKTYESSYKKKSVRSNNLTAGVVVELFPCGLTNLMVLDLSSNNLSGHLPPCWSNISQDVIFANNKFSGATPSTFSCSKQLTVVSFKNNNLTGDFPIDLKFCTGLQFLDLGENKYLGDIPDWVGENLHQLTYLRLPSNLFSGNIPSTLTRLEYLQVLDLGNNHLSGPLPSHLDNFTDMGQSFHDLDFDYGESLQTITKGSNLVYDSINLYWWKSIDLSNNNLTGEIPQNIVFLDGLLNLNLCHNHLIGEIPFEIGNMTSLESLDLHMNNLSGTIPQSISLLYSLEVLNLSYNNLSGSIPTGHQLQSLDDPSIYSGNPNLCGSPLKMSCETSKSDDNNDSKSKHVGDRDHWFYLFIEFGFVVGFLVVFFILLFKRNWRYDYFRMIDYMFLLH